MGAELTTTNDVAGRRIQRRRLVPLVIVVAAMAVAALSLRLASTPTYDPWSWIIWGREAAHLDLDTRAGPAWKPLPVVFTTLFAPAGDAAPLLWLVVARAGAILAVVMAYQLGCRLHGRLAGAAAVVAVLTTDELVGYLAPLGMSEPLVAGLVVAAVERHLAGRHRQAFVAAVGASLLRPEAWPFLAVYALVLWRRERGSGRWRAAIVGGLLAVPVLWYLPEWWGSGDAFRSARRAQVPTEGGPLLQDHPGLAVLEIATRYPIVPVTLLAMVAVAWAVVTYARSRQQGATLAVGALAGGWIAVVAVMAQLRLAAGDRRYLFVAVVLAAVLAGVGFARVVQAAGAWSPTPGAIRPVLVGIALAAASTPAVVHRIAGLDEDADGLAYQERLMADLRTVIDNAGGADEILSCGQPFTGPYMLPAVAWHLGRPLFGVRYFDFELGAVFRSSPELGAAPEPFTLPAALDYRTTASSPTWEIRTACRAGVVLADRVGRPADVE